MVDIARVKKRGGGAVIAGGVTILAVRPGVGPMPPAFGKWKLNEVCWKISVRWYASPPHGRASKWHVPCNIFPFTPFGHPLETPSSLPPPSTALQLLLTSDTFRPTRFSTLLPSPSRRAFSIPSLRSGVTPGGHLWYQSTEAFPRNWFLRNVKQAGSYAAPCWTSYICFPSWWTRDIPPMAGSKPTDRRN